MLVILPTVLFVGILFFPQAADEPDSPELPAITIAADDPFQLSESLLLRVLDIPTDRRLSEGWELLEQILREYPETSAAYRAEQLLEELREELNASVYIQF
ncbi:MAG: hypothetical protein IT428_02440 [Planctomycetaceae bacterium]|nr:hypothetical protein [Planctomycetaceae bacterium]